MKALFYCEQCSKQLPAVVSMEGRTITCPFCRQITVLHASYELDAANEEANEEDDEDFLTSASEPFSADLSTSSSRRGEQSAPASPDAKDDSFEFDEYGYATEADREIVRQVELAAESDESYQAMRARFPNFKPNPLVISVPLDKLCAETFSEEYDAEDAQEDGADDYDVDDLIKGVEKPDGGF